MRQNTDISTKQRLVRASDLTEQGYSRQRIMRLSQQGELLHIGRGLYMFPDTEVTEHHTLAQVCLHVPHGIICLASALQFHQLTTQNPWQVWLMVEKGTRAPRMEYPPLHIVRAVGESFSEGVEEHRIEGVPVRVTNVAKTVTDCFKYRNQIGLDVALEALKECLQENRASRSDMRHFAKLCRVEKVITPYIEAFSV